MDFRFARCGDCPAETYDFGKGDTSGHGTAVTAIAAAAEAPYGPWLRLPQPGGGVMTPQAAGSRRRGKWMKAIMDARDRALQDARSRGGAAKQFLNLHRGTSELTARWIEEQSHAQVSS